MPVGAADSDRRSSGPTPCLVQETLKMLNIWEITAGA